MPNAETEYFLSETKFGQANLIPKTRPGLKIMPIVKCQQTGCNPETRNHQHDFGAVFLSQSAGWQSYTCAGSGRCLPGHCRSGELPVENCESREIEIRFWFL